MVGARGYLGDHQQGEVKAVHEQVSDAVLDILLGALHITLDEQLLQAGGDHILHQQAVVTPHCFDTLGVHLVMGVRVRPQQPGIPLFVDEQVWEVDLQCKIADILSLLLLSSSNTRKVAFTFMMIQHAVLSTSHKPCIGLVHVYHKPVLHSLLQIIKVFTSVSADAAF